jgi:very-short-patch-repair endonuclease
VSDNVRGVAESTLENAREMRRGQTLAERALWDALRGRRLGGLKFRRQYALGGYILDFCCTEQRLVIELDGAGHDEPEQAAYDAQRSQDLTDYGYTVLRFRNEVVLGDIGSVLAVIERCAFALTPCPSPNSGGGE